jgi:hypothetical protein
MSSVSEGKVKEGKVLPAFSSCLSFVVMEYADLLSFAPAPFVGYCAFIRLLVLQDGGQGLKVSRSNVIGPSKKSRRRYWVAHCSGDFENRKIVG